MKAGAGAHLGDLDQATGGCDVVLGRRAARQHIRPDAVARNDVADRGARAHDIQGAVAGHDIHLAPNDGISSGEAPHEVGEGGEVEVDVDPDDRVERTVRDLLGEERRRRPLGEAY